MLREEIKFMREICLGNGFSLSESQLELLDCFALKVLEWNARVNLVSRKDEKNIWRRHILPSIALLFQHKFLAGARILDVGTGGGIPGIPLAIVNPTMRFMLVDSIQKKINAVRDVIGYLGLKNVQTLCGRVEVLGREEKHAGSVDYAIARGVAPMSDIIGWVKPWLKGGNNAEQDMSNDRKVLIQRGCLVLLKGGNLDDEIVQARKLHTTSSITVYPTDIKGLESIVVDKKLVVVQLC